MVRVKRTIPKYPRDEEEWIKMISIIDQNQALLQEVVKEKEKLKRNKATLQRKVEMLERQLEMMRLTRNARSNNNNENNLLKRYNRLYAHGVL
jgi:hypothetical protein